MKKYFLSIVALAGMLFATSCQESLVEPQVDGTTTFTIEVPGQMGTKAASDVINRLYVEVYSADGSTLVHRPDFYTMADGKATVTLNLVANQEYDIIFWAQNGEAYNTESLKSIKMNELHHNSENGAAFYAVLDNYNPINGKQEVKLTRPFAQLNLWTTNEVDYGSGEVTIVKSTIKVENAASEFNRVNDENFGKGIASTTYTYVSDVLPQGTKTINNGTKDIVYQYVSMDYLAVPENEALVNITATIVVKDPNGVESTITRTIDGVPVQMNYRTNIIGNLITSASDFEVVISEDWAGEDKTVEFREVSTAAELQDAIDDDVKEIVLVADIELDQPLVFGDPAQSQIARASATETPSFILDLGNRTISNPNDYVIENYADLTILANTDGGLNGKGVIRSHKGKITIEGGTYTASSRWQDSQYQHILKAVNTEVVINDGIFDATIGGTTNAMFNASEDGEITINGGIFKNVNGEISQFAPYIFTYENNGKLIINDGDFYGGWRFNGVTATTEINGGTFTVSYDGQSFHASSTHVLTIYGGVFSLENGGKLNPTEHCAEGYQAVLAADGKTYVVLPTTENYDIVITDPAQLNNAVLGDKTNILLQLAAREYTIELYTNITDSDSRNLTIIGTEGTKVKFANQQVRLYLFKNFTIKNCEILHMETKKWGMLVFSSGDKEDGVYTIENCTFNGVGTQGIYINEEKTGAKYNIINCTFNGDFGGEGAITISTHQGVKHTVNVTGCKFNNIPENSHRILLTKSTAGLFYDFTLNTDLEATTAYELEMFLALGEAQLGCDLTFSAKETSANSGYGATGVIVSNGAVLDGQGNTLTVNDAWGTWDCVVAAKGGRIENLTVSGAMRGIFMPGADGDVYIDNVIFDNVIYTFNSDAGNKNYGVYISNSTLNGWTSHSDAHKEVVYTNCSFGKGNGYKFCRPYGPTSFVGCNFCEGYEIEAIGKITFENCTIRGVALTSENLNTLVIGGLGNATVK